MITNLNLSMFNQKIYDIEEKKMPIKFLGYKPVVIDFYADWCGPCKAMEPTFERLAEEYSDSADFYKVNVDDSDGSVISRFFNIRSIPTTVCISVDQSKKYVSVTGAMPESILRQHIEEVL